MQRSQSAMEVGILCLHRREKQEKNNTNTDNNSSVGSNMIICIMDNMLIIDIHTYISIIIIYYYEVKNI